MPGILGSDGKKKQLNSKQQTPYTSSKNIKKEVIDIQELSKEDLYNVGKYAEYLGGSNANFLPNSMVPSLINDILKGINQNPSVSTKTDLEKALSDPSNSENILRHNSQYFENTLMIYKRILERNGKLLSFDYTYNAMYVKNTDYSKSKYINDENILIDFMDRFSVKSEFKKVTQKLIREDSHFCYFRDDRELYTLQELSSDYCKITAKDEYGFLFDFDMTFFFRYPSVRLDEYPEIFNIWYTKLNKEMNVTNNIPRNGHNKRTGNYAYWIRLERKDNVWCWKFNNVQVAQIPPFSSLFLDLLNATEIRSLQKNKYIISATRILIGLIPLLTDSKSSTLKDRIAIEADTVGKFMYLLRAGINDAISVGAAPFSDIKEFDFSSTNSDINIQEDHISNIIARQAGIPDLIFPDDKMNATSAKNAIAIEEYIMKSVYPDFSKFLFYHIGKRTTKYKFKIMFEGVDTPQSRERRAKQANDNATIGIVLPQKIAAAWGMEPQDMIRQMEMGRDSKFIDKLMNIQSIFNPVKDSVGGRPTSSDSNISDSGEATRDSDSNTDKEA